LTDLKATSERSEQEEGEKREGEEDGEVWVSMKYYFVVIKLPLPTDNYYYSLYQVRWL